MKSLEKKKRVNFITSKTRKSHKSSNVLNSAVNPSLNKSEYYSKMRNSIFNKHKKSQDKFYKQVGKSSQTTLAKDERDSSYTSKILEKRRKALQKNLSAQKLEKTSQSRTKKNVSLSRKNWAKEESSSFLAGQIYPKIQKKRKLPKETSSSYNHLVPKNSLSKLNQSYSSNNLTFLAKKKFEENPKVYEGIKKSYSKGFHKSKAFLVTSENFLNFKRRKNILQRSPNQKPNKSSSKKYAKDRLQEKNRKINRSLQYKQKNSFSNKVCFFNFFAFFDLSFFLSKDGFFSFWGIQSVIGSLITLKL